MAEEGCAFAPKSLEEWLAEAKRCEREGELFRAYDLAMQGLARHPQSLELKHLAVVVLASTGALEEAARKFSAFGLDRAAAGAPSQRLRMDIESLKARLLKDGALRCRGEERRRALASAARLYEGVFAAESAAGNPESHYPGVNAASLYLLAAEPEKAAPLAALLRENLASLPPERCGYWERASEIEALIVLGRAQEAREKARALRRLLALPSAVDYRAWSSTIRQLRLLVAAKGLGAECLAELAPPRVVHFLGHIIAPPGKRGRFPAREEARVAAAIETRIAGAGIGFGYGSLAAGADILFAEALLRHGASLNIVLPFDRREFVEVSVRPSGARWVERFEACIAAAEREGSLRFATEDRYLGDEALFGYCSQLAMGLAILRSQHLSSEVEQIAVWDGAPSEGPAGTGADVAIWKRSGRPQWVIPCGEGKTPPRPTPKPERATGRRTRAMLFGDIKGYSRLSDVELPRFVDAVLAAFAKVIDGYGAGVLAAETWGDGIYLVFDDAGEAAGCALDLQQAMASIDLEAAGLPGHLALRIGGHLGPVYGGHNPIMKKDSFFGAHVTRAARIEPVTPEGCVYVTETLAAVLALHNPRQFVSDYVGMTEAAKDYGRMRLFHLRGASR